MHRRGGHRAACSGLVDGQQNGSSMGSRLCKTEVVVTASAGKEDGSPPSHFPSLGQQSRGLLHGHTRPQKPPLTDRPGYYTPHHHFPTTKLGKHKPSTRCAQLGPLCGWLQSRSCAPLARVALCPPTCGTSIAAATRRDGCSMPDGGGESVTTATHAATWRGCRWLLTPILSSLPSLRCARAKPAGVVSSRDRRAAPSSHRDGRELS